MKDQIQDIITRFGPRLAGSQAERGAQEYIASQMQQLTGDVQIETFQAPLSAKFGKMKWYAIGYMISLVLFLFSPVGAMITSLICGIVLVCDLMRNDGIADFLFPLETSRNVSATLEPQGTVTSTLIFSGHIDSTLECAWWYRYKTYGAHITIAAGLLIALFPVFAVWFVTSGQMFPAQPGEVTANVLIYFLFVLLSPLTVIYFSFHGDIVVDGASDNLSGTIISKNVVSAFADPDHKGMSTLKNTRIRFISFGAEEKGLRGSTAYCRKHLRTLQDENAYLVNIDSIRLANEISIVTGEMMSFVIFDERLVSKTEKAFHALNIPYKKGMLPMGGTDAIPFQQRRIPSLSIIGMNMKSLDPTYHTRLDTIDNVEQAALDNVKSGLIELIKEWDTV
jgi:aminopeptidase YwaD